nr:helix-hairpin-helix domain-containing protein [Cytophagales bacterium]
MKNIRKFVVLSALQVFQAALYAQDELRQDIDIEAFIEELFALQEEEINYEDLYESLLQTHLNRLPLNQVQAEGLQSLYILSPLQVNSLLSYREQVGPLLSIYELQAVPHWDLETIRRIAPFVTIGDSAGQPVGGLWRKLKDERDAYFILRHRRVWQMRKGFTPPDTLRDGSVSSRYQGDPNDLYARFRIQHANDYSIGFTLNKSQGEAFVWDQATDRYGFNFSSFHATFMQKGRWKSISLGDYQLQFGQGLVYGAGFSVGKGAESITTVRRSTLGVRPYSSVLEFGFFRGAAATYQVGRWELTGHYSRAPRDARIQTQVDSLDQPSDFFSSLLQSGLHRTSSEISAKSQAREDNVGGNINYRSANRNFQWGMNTLFTRYNRPFIPTARVYNGFEFRGESNQVHSTYFSHNYQNYFFFGESAVSKSGGQGSILGVMSSLHPHINLSLLWRKFDRNFHTFYGNAFSEGTRPINEEGVYLGLSYTPSRKFSWNGYYDYFRFPWMRFRVYAPSQGSEWLMRWSYRPDKRTHLFVQVRQESKARNLLSAMQQGVTYQLAQANRRNFVVNLDHQFSAVWSMKSRIQASRFTFGESNTAGFAIVQDVQGEWNNLRISGRLALFDTEDYENRQYVYEKNVLWAFSLPAYHGQGLRYYLLGQWRISQKLTLWARWARTAYTDRESIGTGLQEIQGNAVSETTAQLRYQFNR